MEDIVGKVEIRLLKDGAFKMGIRKERVLKSGDCPACYGDGWNDIPIKGKKISTLRRMFCHRCNGTGKKKGG